MLGFITMYRINDGHIDWTLIAKVDYTSHIALTKDTPYLTFSG